MTVTWPVRLVFDFAASSSAPTTVALPMVNNLELFDVTHNSMQVRWRGAEGASGYMILYAPLTEGDPADEKEVRGPYRGETERQKKKRKDGAMMAGQ